MQHTFKLVIWAAPSDEVNSILSTIKRRHGQQDPIVLPNMTIAVSDDEHSIKSAYMLAKEAGITCTFEHITHYDASDAMAGDLGILHFGPSSHENFKAFPPKDAFDFSSACVKCGLGAVQLKPHIVSGRSLKSKAQFFTADQSGRIFMRSEIAQEIIEATKQPWCMRHPHDRSGKVVSDWMEVVPCATMPALSEKSSGINFGRTDANTSPEEPIEVVPPCPVCGVQIWDLDRSKFTKILYSTTAIAAAQNHAIVAMREPWVTFPGFDPTNRTFKSLCGAPWLLFNRKAIRVLLKHIRFAEGKNVRDTAFIHPVFSE